MSSIHWDVFHSSSETNKEGRTSKLLWFKDMSILRGPAPDLLLSVIKLAEFRRGFFYMVTNFSRLGLDALTMPFKKKLENTRALGSEEGMIITLAWTFQFSLRCVMSRSYKSRRQICFFCLYFHFCLERCVTSAPFVVWTHTTLAMPRFF